MSSRDPVLENIPEAIRTKRLLIRAPKAGDGVDVNAAIIESLDELKPWMPWASVKPSADDTEANVRRAAASWILREDLRFNIYDGQSSAFLGSTGLHRINWAARNFEIGYWIRSSEVGKGFVTEAVAALTTFAYSALSARRIEIRCAEINFKSRAVAERLGFNLEATLKDDGVLSDGVTRRSTAIYVRFDAANLPDVKASW